uniref:Uncharacterized protein n=1 Tax=Cannabis sativa TaxID=3483 RepID=A0A803PMQ1_CANSA
MKITTTCMRARVHGGTSTTQSLRRNMHEMHARTIVLYHVRLKREETLLGLRQWSVHVAMDHGGWTTIRTRTLVVQATLLGPEQLRVVPSRPAPARREQGSSNSTTH